MEDETFKPSNSQELSTLKKALNCMEKQPKTFDDCLKYARIKFNKFFVLDILQLLYVYPLDAKTKEETPFWTLPKRPPVKLEYDPADSLHSSFIAATACLRASIYKVEIPFENPRSEASKSEMAHSASKFEVKEFTPDEGKAKAISNEVKKEAVKKDEPAAEEEEEEVSGDDDAEEMMKTLISLREV
jgi:ubiquitin-activating enzyme E1